MSRATERLPVTLRRPLVAGALLLLLYLLMSLALDPNGHLGTDTGAKVYTLEVMDRLGTADPDIGYWAEDLDPEGVVHPIYQTRARHDGGWVAVTTLPVLELARPLYAIGGYRATLLLPMLGSVGVAFGARSLAMRLGAVDGRAWAVFWLIGLGSPAFIYALDFWEHSIGLACMVGAVALMTAFVEDRRWTSAAAGGVLLGFGATLRNETIVYAVVMVALAGLWLMVNERSVRRPIVLGLTTVGGFAVPWTANLLLERAVDGPSRASRATGTAARVGEQSPRRIEDAVQTLTGLNSGDPYPSALLGVVLVVVVLAAWRAERRGDRQFAFVALAAVGIAYIVDAVGGLGFVPGLLLAFPLAIAGLVGGRRHGAATYLWGVAVASLPVVYAFQYLGGAPAQWGGRYSLTSGIILGVLGFAVVAVRAPFIVGGLAVLSVVVSVLGVAWVVQRSHEVDRFFEQVVAEAEPVVIARQAFLIREAGAAAVDRRWLSADSEEGFTKAVDVAREIGEERISVLAWNAPVPPDVALPTDLREVDRTLLSFLDTPVGLVTYAFTD